MASQEILIGRKIRALRQALPAEEGRPVSQETLARRAGISLLTLGDIERGYSDPKSETVRKIAGALGVSPGVLMEED